MRAASFPWHSEIVNETACETELGVGGGDEPAPAVGLVGCAQRWCCPAEGSFEEAECVLDVEAAQVGAPAAVDVGFARA